MNKWISGTVGLLAVIAAIFAINIIGSRLNLRMDVTDDSIFTLSDGTRNILSKVDQDVQVKFYFSRSSKELPVIIKTYATRVEELLGEYASLSSGQITLEVYDPKPDTDEEEWAQKYGLRGMKLPSGGDVFFGAVFIAGDVEVAVPYFDPRREEFLEYDLTEAVVRLNEDKKSKIAVLSSLPVVAAAAPNPYGQQGPKDWVFIQQLKRMYEVESLAPDAAEVPADVSTLIVFHPKDIPESSQYAIDQFVLRGGRLMVFVDPFSRTDLASSAQMGMQQRMQQKTSSDLKELFTSWGVEYKADEMVGDLKHTLQINAGGQVVSYPFFMGLDESSVDKEHVITSQLSNLLLAEPGAFSVTKESGLELTSLIHTDKDSGTVGAMMAQFMGPADLAKQIKIEEKERTLAGVVSGNFKTAFPDGPPKSESPPPKAPHLTSSKDKNFIFIVADIDFIADQNSVDQIQLGPQVIVRPKNDNLSFVINAVDFMGGDKDLISIRSRGKISRPFTKVQEIQVSAQKKWKDQEEKLSAELSDLQKKLTELQSGRTQGNRLVLSDQQQGEVKRFQDRVSEVSRKRREVRKNLREDIESLGKSLVAANMVFVPFLVSLFGVAVFRRRNKGRRRS
ncbi:Gldg family protein [Oligoflexaceae bacterium]|nr:Gldg family protein [Oligoflexaceae bacterium]